MKPRLLAVFLGAGAVLTLLGGLARLVPFQFPQGLLVHHGVLMCAVFLPGVIGLERAVALGRGWAWVAPLAALASFLPVCWVGRTAAPLLVFTALALCAQQISLWRRQPGLDGPVAVAGSLILAGSDACWGWGINPTQCALGWASFLILLIAAERLELSFLCRTSSKPLLTVVVALAAGLASSQNWAVGWAWVLLSLWLARYDLARRLAFRQGLPAYTARAVLLGYFWLVVSGAQLALLGLRPDRLDSILHGVFVGFVLSMVVAHGPIVVPAVGKIPVAYSAWFYLPLTLLHVSLAIRVLGSLPLGGILNFTAVIVFVITLACNVRPGHNPWLTGPIRGTAEAQVGDHVTGL